MDAEESASLPGEILRGSFFKSLFDVAEKDRSVVIMTADMGYNLLERFRDSLPGQYVNSGIAEANTVTMSAGMALTGKKVFAYSIAPFISFRCLEQIRVDVCYQDADVKLVGVGGGLDYGQSGTTHHSIEDIAVMRALPGISVVCPGDPCEATALPSVLVRYNHPVYIRLGRGKEPMVHKITPAMEIGRGIAIGKVHAQPDMTIFCTGNILDNSSRAVSALEKHGLKVNLFSMPWVKPIDQKLILDEAEKSRMIVTVEEHIHTGGLRSAVADVFSENDISIPLRAICLPDKFQKTTGSQIYLRKLNGIDDESIEKRIHSWFKQLLSTYPVNPRK